MKSALIATLAIFFCRNAEFAAENKSLQLKTAKDKTSYSMGNECGHKLQTTVDDINADIFMKGFKDALSGAKPLLLMMNALDDIGRSKGSDGKTDREDDSGRWKKQEGGRNVPRREHEERRVKNLSQRFAV